MSGLAAAIIEAAFYTTAFGATEALRLTSPDGRIGHAHLSIGTRRSSCSPNGRISAYWHQATVGGTPVSLHLSVEDADTVVTRTADAGATVLRAEEETVRSPPSVHSPLDQH